MGNKPPTPQQRPQAEKKHGFLPISSESSLADKELRATQELLHEHSQNKQWEAEERMAHRYAVPEDNSGYEYKYQREELPLDDEGFVVSFRPDQEEEYLHFFKKYNVVVVRDILTDDECSASEDELWSFVERHAESVDRNDSSTWDKWTSLKRLGMLGSTIALPKQFCENRQNPILHRVFTILLGNEKLWVNVGRASAMRPTKGVKMSRQGAEELGLWPPSVAGSKGESEGGCGDAEAKGSSNASGEGEASVEVAAPEGSDGGDVAAAAEAGTGAEAETGVGVGAGAAVAANPSGEDTIRESDEDTVVVDIPGWKTLPKWLHWDMNPWTGATTTFSWRVRDQRLNRGYDMVKVQGVLALADCRLQDGGFHCVPGFRRHLRGWAHANQQQHFRKEYLETAGSMQVPADDPIRQDVQRVPVRRGSVIIWDSCLPHANYPNDSDRLRMVQYIKMMNCADPSVRPLFDNPDLLPPDFQLTPLGRKLYGFDSWEKEEGGGDCGHK